MTDTARAFGGVRVRDALDSARIPLAAAGCESPELDAELLLAEVIGVDRAALISHPERELAPGQARRFQELVVRRRQREPVAYILGRRGFRHLELAVDRRVLIPRPETELLVEAVLDLPQGARVVDIGTGSGAVALALKQERPDLEVVASDSSAEALVVARANAERLGLEVDFLVADLLSGVPGPLDAVVANPPYVAEGHRGLLAPEILEFEPAEALFGGPDGLAVIRRLVTAAWDAGARVLALEMGAGQAEDVAALVRGAGFPDVELRADLAGIDRVAIGRR